MKKFNLSSQIKTSIGKSLIFGLLFTTLALFSSKALAQTFQESVEMAQSTCPQLTCNEAGIHLKTMTNSEWRNLPPFVRQNLQHKVAELAMGWGDTILENDYYANTQIKIDRVEHVLNGTEVIGYHLIYSAKAWNTGDCRFDPEDKKTLSTCPEGRIIEAGFVSLDFEELFVNYAIRIQFRLIP